MTPTDTLLATLDPDPVLRGRQFEQLMVTLLRTHPLWASELADVWPWATWPGRWGPDCGMDAVPRAALPDPKAHATATDRLCRRGRPCPAKGLGSLGIGWELAKVDAEPER